MLKPGKIDKPNFEDIILAKCGAEHKEVSTGPGFGVDVSVVDITHELAMALTSDPLSLIPSLGLEESAWLSVHLMANDMATTGFAPKYAQLVLNLPPHLSGDDLTTYWNYVHKFCTDINVAITGGHTGTIEGQNSTIAGGGTMITFAPKKDILISKNAKPGNVILMSKQSAISSSAILAMSFKETVIQKLGKEIYEEGCGLFYQTSSLKEAMLVSGLYANNSQVTGMHDVTEGGVLGAVYEMAVASGNGAIVYTDKIPVGHAQRQLCNLFSIDPLYCIGAGSMLITVEKDFVNNIIEALTNENITCSEIGEIVDRHEGINLFSEGHSKPLEYQQNDPYWEAFFSAMKKGWK